MNQIPIDGIIGARPNLMKMAPLARAIAEDGTFDLRLIHTGQHYDERMSGALFAELGLPLPAINLNVGSGRHGEQTAKIIDGYERILFDQPRPAGVLVVGDVTSTMAAAIVASKLAIPVAHVEAGLRSGDRTMPEEINRIVTDALSDILLVSDPDGLVNLAREGHSPENIEFVGNVMMDTLFRELPNAQKSTIVEERGLKVKEYVYLTLHRPSNVDDPDILRRLMTAISDICRDIPMVFAVHPRTRAKLDAAGIDLAGIHGLHVLEPLAYRDNLRMIQSAFAVLTDSGGIQEETSVLGIPCITLRFNTERPVTVRLGTSELVGSDAIRLCDAWERLRTGRWKQGTAIPLWEGRAAGRIVAALRAHWAPAEPAESAG